MWVGVDGFNTQYLEQIGTEQDVVNGQPVYYAWFEMLPQQATEQVIPGFTINPGDSISASVTLTGSTSTQKTFFLSITDNSTGLSYSTTQTTAAAAPAETAEWIMEATTENGSVATLANFGTASFSAASATMGGFTGPAGSPGWQSTPINITGTASDTTSLIAVNGQFSVYYGSSAPATTTPGTTPVWITAGTNSSSPGATTVTPFLPLTPFQANPTAPLGFVQEPIRLPQELSDNAEDTTSPDNDSYSLDALTAAVLGLHKHSDDDFTEMGSL
jgi:hypothetical protein